MKDTFKGTSFDLKDKEPLIFTSKEIGYYYLDSLLEAVGPAKVHYIKEGEENKTLEQYEEVLRVLASYKNNVPMPIVFGGGMIGDLGSNTQSL